jgi:hypothetical protein
MFASRKAIDWWSSKNCETKRTAPTRKTWENMRAKIFFENFNWRRFLCMRISRGRYRWITRMWVFYSGQISFFRA